jgi:hypothetical protein
MKQESCKRDTKKTVRKKKQKKEINRKGKLRKE